MAETYEAMQARLTKAFNAVCKKDWRAPIDAVLTKAQAEVVGGIEVIREAVIHFTATVPLIDAAPGGTTIRVRAIGYRAGPAGP